MLSLGLSLTSVAVLNQRGGPDRTLCDAISSKTQVAAIHGKQAITLAPHIVYKRANGELALDAVPGNGEALRTYTVAKLADIKAVGTPFEPLDGFDPNRRKYREKTICVVKLD